MLFILSLNSFDKVLFLEQTIFESKDFIIKFYDYSQKYAINFKLKELEMAVSIDLSENSFIIIKLNT